MSCTNDACELHVAHMLCCGLSVKCDDYSKCLYMNTGPHSMLDKSGSLSHTIFPSH